MTNFVEQYQAKIKATEPADARIYLGQVNTYEEWDAMLEDLWSRGLLTRNQWRALRPVAHRFLPAMISVNQRNVKQTTYFVARGKGEIKCNNRAKIELSFDTRTIS
jgi:hypothetical protein